MYYRGCPENLLEFEPSFLVTFCIVVLILGQVLSFLKNVCNYYIKQRLDSLYFNIISEWTFLFPDYFFQKDITIS
jgi:hypothetical protein